MVARRRAEVVARGALLVKPLLEFLGVEIVPVDETASSKDCVDVGDGLKNVTARSPGRAHALQEALALAGVQVLSNDEHLPPRLLRRVAVAVERLQRLGESVPLLDYPHEQVIQLAAAEQRRIDQPFVSEPFEQPRRPTR